MPIRAPFNFYQGTGWSPWYPVSDGYVDSGIVPPVPLTYLDFLTGFWLDPALEAGHSAGFTKSITTSPIYQGHEISGEVVTANPHTVSFYGGWRGDFYPFFIETGSVIGQIASGFVSSGSSDVPTVSVGMSGGQSGALRESGTLSFGFVSGNAAICAIDSGKMQYNMTGAVGSGLFSRMTNEVTLYGAFQPTYPDAISGIALWMTEIYWDDQGAVAKEYGRGETGWARFRFSRIAYTNY